MKWHIRDPCVRKSQSHDKFDWFKQNFKRNQNYVIFIPIIFALQKMYSTQYELKQHMQAQNYAYSLSYNSQSFPSERLTGILALH